LLPDYLMQEIYQYKVQKAKINSLDNPIYEQRRQHYWDDEGGIVDFAHDVIGMELHDYQKRILNSLQKYRRVSVKSLRGVGKTAMASVFILWAVTCCPTEIKIICTASVWEQLTKYLFPEIRKWAFQADFESIGVDMRDGKEILAREIQLNQGQKHVFMTSPNVAERIEGAHAATVVYVFDEAKIIPDEIFDAIEGAFATAGTNAFVGVFSTPGAPIGRFYDIHRHATGLEHWHTESVSLDEALDAGMIDIEHVETQKRLWGEDSPLFQNHFLGEFAESSDWGIIKLSWIQDAVNRWHKAQEFLDYKNDEPKVVWGVDPADTGVDNTAISRWVGNVCEYVKYFNEEVMVTIPRLIKLGINKETDLIAFDGLGIGAGAYQVLRNDGYAVKNIKFSAKAVDRVGNALTDSTGINTFQNTRVAAYWALREALDPSSAAFANIALPPDDKMIQDLIVHEYSESMGVIRMKESKDKIRDRIGRSPDGGDAIALAWYLISTQTRRRRSNVIAL